MPQRVTIKDLNALADLLNVATNSLKEYSQSPKGKFSANIGHFHIS